MTYNTVTLVMLSHIILSRALFLCSKSRKEKKKNNNLVVLPSHNNSGIIEMFMDWKIVVRHGFRLQKLKRPVIVRNINRTNNSASAITHQVEVNVYYKNYIKRMKIDIYNLERTEVILGVP